ncbi:hypothetical protein OAS_16730 [Vibrio cyclitrophicus ZF65]|nr:hypothetical protein OAS_16730 [Vibrio cyclitrophicus ZF65]PMJ78619.1 hypothetical protein BCU15_13275 [Vibrio cyclitrophicus]PMK23549.1 hypothetical protein BCU04_15375 [Vibrio cyclitrophicus]
MDFALMFIRRFMFISRLMLMIKIRLIKVGAGHLGHEKEAGKSLRTRLLFRQEVSVSRYSTIKSSNDVIEVFNKPGVPVIYCDWYSIGSKKSQKKRPHSRAAVLVFDKS